MSNPASNRRDFLRSTAALTAAGATAPYWFTGENARADETKSKNDRPHIGVIGLGIRSRTIVPWAAKFGEVVAVCDVDLDRAQKAKAAYGNKADIYQDYRKLLDRKDIDIIVNATPDHWHTAINIAACKSGRDIYAEKPLTLTIDEGKIICKVVEETGRIVQVGTNQRSMRCFQTAVELVRNGRIGKLQQVWVALPYFSTQGGPFAKQPVPPQFNWDLYQGQAPERDYCFQRSQTNFNYWYDYSGGVITGWGAHHVDIAHWGMDCDLSGPTTVEARGVFPNPPGAEYYDTPDRFFSRLMYPNGVEVLYFVTMNERIKWGGTGAYQEMTPAQLDELFGKDVPDDLRATKRNGIMFIGDKGRIFANRGGVHGKAVDELKSNPLPADAWRAYPSTDHMANFFDCVKTRKQPCTPVQLAHRSITACHLTNISLRLKRKIAWNPAAQQIVGDPEANAWQNREQRAPYLVRG